MNVQCITAPCAPIQQTFSNLCEAEKLSAHNIIEGPCYEVIDFETCLAAGNPAMESHPRQCRHNNKTYIEVLKDPWRSDGIELRQHETESTYGCFGCSTATNGPALCVDPIFEMKQVEETPERYCSSDFEVVENI